MYSVSRDKASGGKVRLNSALGTVEVTLRGELILEVVPVGGAVHDVEDSFRELQDALCRCGSVPPSFTLAEQIVPWAPGFWECVRAIPRGETLTYGQLAERLGLSSGYARAVGGALGRNRIAILNPCHRVVSANGPGGYAWGREAKRSLLNTERES